MSTVPSLSHVTFERFSPGVKYFEDQIYRRADEGRYHCVKRFDSTTPLDHQCSFVATNTIIRVLTRDVVPPCWKLKGMVDTHGTGGREAFSLMWKGHDRFIEETMDAVYLGKDHLTIPSWSFYRETQKNAAQLELIHRTVNIFGTFFTKEVAALQAIIGEKRQEKEIFGVRPGSIVDAVAKRAHCEIKAWGWPNWEDSMPLVPIS